VLALIATGLSNDEISRKIYISPATVKTHASRAMTKLGAIGKHHVRPRNRQGAAAFASCEREGVTGS
jgi:DNA-binding CsgD family transcriptional regulator